MDETPKNPFVGPRPIERGQPIFGRDAEITELYDLLFAERIVLLHSPSGAGKSSLIQAGLIPRLAEQFDVWKPVRVNLPPQSGDRVNRFVRSCNIGFEAGIPKRLQRDEESLSAMSLAAYVAGRPIRPSAPKNIVLIFDQFEEILTVDPLGVEAKREFFAELGKLLQDNPRIWALFAIREDYLAPFDPFAEELPTHLKSRFRLDLLGRKAAEEAICRTAEAGGRSFAPQALGRLVADLAMMQVQQPGGEFTTEPGPYIEPLHLQVVCRNLWERMAPDRTVIEDGDIESFGDVTGALAEYYNAEVAKAAGSNERIERAIRAWVGNMLITRGNIRGQVLREAGKSGGLDNSLIQGLIEAHLVRGEQRAGATWYELSHDRLIKPVQESNKSWFGLHLSELQKTASLWAEQGKPEGLLLLAGSLKRARVWAVKNRPLTATEDEFLTASVDKNRSKQFQIAVFCTVIALALAAIVGGIFARRERDEARSAVVQASISNVLQTVDNHGNSGVALAYLSRALRIDPHSVGARAWATDLLTRKSWWLPTIVLEEPPVRMAEMSADGRRVVTMTKEGMVQIWDAETGVRQGQPFSINGPITDAERSPDGRHVFIVSGPSGQMWDMETQKLVCTVSGHSGDIFEERFNTDGKRLVTTARDNSARVWDAETCSLIGNPIRRQDAEPNQPDPEIYSAELSGDGRRVVTAFADKAQVWDAATTQPVGTPIKTDSARVRINPDGTKVLTIANTNKAAEAVLWDVATGRDLLHFLHDDWVTDARFSHDGKSIATASFDETGKIWDTSTGRLQRILNHENTPFQAEFSEGDNLLVTLSRDNSASVWDVSTGEMTGNSLQHGRDLVNYRIAPSGNRLMTSSDNAAQVWKLEHRIEEAGQAVAFKGSLADVRFTHSGARIAFVSADGSVRVIDEMGKPVGNPIAVGIYADSMNAYVLPDGERVITLDNVNQTFQFWENSGKPVGKAMPFLDGAQLFISPHGLRVLIQNDQDHQGQFQVFDAKTGNGLKSYTIKDVVKLHISQDSRRFVADLPTGAQVFELDTGAPIGKPIQCDGGVADAELSPNGKRLVTACKDTAQVWEIATGKTSGKPLEHREKVKSAKFSPDGLRILTQMDRTAQIWDARSGERLGDILRPRGWIKTLSFSPDNQTVLTVSESPSSTGSEDAVQVWEATSGKPIGEPITEDKDIGFAVFISDGREVLTGSDGDGEVRIFRVFLGSGTADDSKLLAELGEVVGGYLVNKNTNSIELLEPKERFRRMQQLREQYHVPAGDDFLEYFIKKLSEPLPEKH
jgi:WD40 repeat protein